MYLFIPRNLSRPGSKSTGNAQYVFLANEHKLNHNKSCQKTTKFAERQPNLNSNI